MIRYHARWVVPVSDPSIEHGTVGVDERVISYVGPRAGAPAGEDVDLGEVVLLPGLVNAHTRLELTAMRGVPEELPFFDWERTQHTRAWPTALTDDQLVDCARLGVVEGLAAGITTFADTSASGASLRAMRALGVRGVVYQDVVGPAPEHHDEALAGLRAAVDRLRAHESDLVRVGVSPHSVYSVHEDLLIDACAVALGERLPIAIHVAESAEEIEFLREARGPFAELLRERGIPVVRRAYSPVHLLVELGVDIAHPLLIHCVQLEPSDIAFIAERGCPVVHCPGSNAKLGHGIAPVVELLAAGAVVGLGTDSVASSNRMDLLDEARLAALLQRVRTRSPAALPAATALRLATLGGARALGLDDRVGSLAVGKDADLAAFSLADARGTPVQDPAVAAVFALAGRPATFVAVAGEVLVRDGRVRGDDPALRARVADAGRRLAASRRSDRSR